MKFLRFKVVGTRASGSKLTMEKVEGSVINLDLCKEKKVRLRGEMVFNSRGKGCNPSNVANINIGKVREVFNLEHIS